LLARRSSLKGSFMPNSSGQVFLALLFAGAGSLLAESQFKANLSGYDEVPTVSTASSGHISVQIAKDEKSLSVTLTFSKLEGVAQSATLHFGAPATSGGVFAFICGSPKPSCPTTTDGTVTTTIAANDIIALTSQGIVAADLAAVIRAIENGSVYANVRTTKFSTGEIRGQLDHGGGPPPGKGKNH
jgi:hypothetical protein